MMDKYADLNWSFSELIAASEEDAKITALHLMDCGHLRYASRQGPCRIRLRTLARLHSACGWKPKTKGYQRKTK